MRYGLLFSDPSVVLKFRGNNCPWAKIVLGPFSTYVGVEESNSGLKMAVTNKFSKSGIKPPFAYFICLCYLSISIRPNKCPKIKSII